jgi:hypothetical protein
MAITDFVAGRKILEIKNRAIFLRAKIRNLKRRFPKTLADDTPLVKHADSLTQRIFEGDRKFMELVQSPDIDFDDPQLLPRMKKLIRLWEEEVSNLCFDLLTVVAESTENLPAAAAENRLAAVIALPQAPYLSSALIADQIADRAALTSSTTADDQQ